jgi:hypothetical protein
VDNQKENVAPSKMFRMVTYEETGVFLEENLNKNANTENIRIGLVFVVLAQ